MHNGRCEVLHCNEIIDVGRKIGKKKRARLSPVMESFVKDILDVTTLGPHER